MNKKTFIALLLALLLSISLVSADEQEQYVGLFIDGAIVKSNVKPFIRDGRTLVPIRLVSEALGIDVEWEGSTQTVTLKQNKDVISFKINSTNATKNNSKKLKMDTPAIIVNGSTFVPIRFVAEAFGKKVNWDGDYQMVIIGDNYEQFEYDDEPTSALIGDPKVEFKSIVWDAKRAEHFLTVGMKWDINKDGVYESVRIGHDSPNGVALTLYTAKEGVNVAYELSIIDKVTNNDELYEDSIIEAALYDFDLDGNPEVLFCIRDKEHYFSIAVLKVSIANGKISAKEIYSINGAYNIALKPNGVIWEYEGNGGTYITHTLKSGTGSQQKNGQIKKIEPSKPYVYEAKLDLSTKAASYKDVDGNKNELVIKMPFINIDNDAAKELNNELKFIGEAAIRRFHRQSEEKSTDNIQYYFEWYEHGDFLSVLSIQKNTDIYNSTDDNTVFRTYLFNLKTGEELTKADLAKEFGYKSENELKNVITNEIKRIALQNYGKNPSDFPESSRDATKSINNFNERWKADEIGLYVSDSKIYAKAFIFCAQSQNGVSLEEIECKK